MTDPTSANKVLVALAERASKRRSQYKKGETNKEAVSLEENQENQETEEEYSQKETGSKFKPKKNIQQPIREEFPPSIEDYSSDETDYFDSEEEEVPIKVSRKMTNFEGNVPVRKSRKSSRLFSRVRNLNPENANTFEEQLDLVGNLLCDKLSAFQAISALRVTQEWIDCIVDENDSFYEEIYKKLILLNKEQLLGYIRILVSALK